MVSERNPIPMRREHLEATQCNGCGARQEVFNGHGILSCAYCGASKPEGLRLEVTCMQDGHRRFLSYTESTGPR